MAKNLTITFSVLIIFSLIFSAIALAKDFELPEAGITPDSPFYFVKSWTEKIQLFFTFSAEQKAKQYLHLAGVRLAEYQKMLEKGKTEIAEKTLTKYQNQLNRALEKAEELKNKGKNVEELTTQIQEATSKHLEILNQNLQKVPEQAKKGIENAIENSQKQIEKILEKPIATPCPRDVKICPDGTSVGRTGPNCEFAECPGEEKAPITEKCGIENCHGLDITCGPNVPEICDLMYGAGDNCRQYASCQKTNGQCQLVKTNKFNDCKFCVEKCEQNFKNNQIDFFQCESKCTE